MDKVPLGLLPPPPGPKHTVHDFHETCHSVTSHCTSQFTPKMKANAEPCLLSSLVWIDSGFVVSLDRLEYFFYEITCNGMTISMNSMKVVIPLNSFYWSIHTKDGSKCGTAFAFIFGVNWLWHSGVRASLGVFFHEIKCNRITSFMEFMNSKSASVTTASVVHGRLMMMRVSGTKLSLMWFDSDISLSYDFLFNAASLSLF